MLDYQPSKDGQEQRSREVSLTARFEELIDRHSREIYGYFLRALRNHHDAEELSQDVFVKAFRHLDSLREPGAVRGWLFSIAVRQLLDHLRSRGRSQDGAVHQLQDEASLTDEGVAPERAAMAREMREFLLEEALLLPERQRSVMLMHMTGAMDYEAMAKALKITTTAAKMSLFHGRERLRERLVWFRERRQS
jgi:RNA polymerase sigma-70 factor (ECF subfamily)